MLKYWYSSSSIASRMVFIKT